MNWQQSEEIYISYAKYMIRMNDFAKARWIFTKTAETYGYEGDVLKEYEKFLEVYGTLEEIIKLREKVNAKPKKIVLK